MMKKVYRYIQKSKYMQGMWIKMKIIDFIKKSIDSICAKYIEENLNEI